MSRDHPPIAAQDYTHLTHELGSCILRALRLRMETRKLQELGDDRL